MASRYWVGGTATWDTTAGTKWAATSGGAGGQTVPGASDDVFFDAASGAATVTWDAAASTTVLTINSTGFTGTHAATTVSKTLAGTGTVWSSPSSCTITGTPTITVSSTGSTAISVTCNSVSALAVNSVNFNFTAGTYSLTLSGTSFRNINFTGSSCTLATSAITMRTGNLTLSTGGTFAALAITISGVGTLISNGKILGATTVGGTGSTLTLGDALTLGQSTFSLLSGNLALAGFTLSAGIFSSSNANTRTISFGSGNIALTSTTAATVILNMVNANGFTWTGTGGFTRNMAATATVSFGTVGGGSSTNAPNLIVNAGSSALTITSISHFKTINFEGFTGSASGSAQLYGNLTLSSGVATFTGLVPTFLAFANITSNGKVLGNTTVDGLGITVTLGDALTVLTTGTFTLSQGTLDLAGFTLSTGIFSSNNINTRAIAFGSSNIALTSTSAGAVILNIDQANNFTWTGTGGFTRNMAATATIRVGSTSGASAANAPNLTVNAGSSLLTILGQSWFKNLNFTGSTCSPASSSTMNIAGDLTLATGGTYTGLQGITFIANSTIISNGKSLVYLEAGGTVVLTLADALSCTSYLQLFTNSNLVTNGFSLTLANLLLRNTSIAKLGASTVTLTASGSPSTLSLAAPTNVQAGTSTINLTSAAAKTFTGAGATFYNVNQGGTGALTITGSNTFNSLTNTVQPATVTFTAGTTQTITNFGLSGTAGNLITINSSTPGTQFTLYDTTGTINAQYLAIQDSIATGGATWNAVFSTNNGNNTGWNITALESFASSNFFLMF